MVSDIDTVSKHLPQHTSLITKGKITAQWSRTQLCDQGNEVYFTTHETPDMMNLQTGSTQRTATWPLKSLCRKHVTGAQLGETPTQTQTEG